MPAERRREKIAGLVREELSKIVDRDVDFPDRTMVTITRVALSQDGQYATVFISILGEEPAAALAILKKMIYDIQKSLDTKLRMRPVPKLTFKLDEEEFRREQVERRIAGLKRRGEL